MWLARLVHANRTHFARKRYSGNPTPRIGTASLPCRNPAPGYCHSYLSINRFGYTVTENVSHQMISPLAPIIDVVRVRARSAGELP
jgi:hypothetical protein